MIKNHILTFPVRFIAARPRLSVAVLVGIISALMLHALPAIDSSTPWIMGWNIGTVCYLVLAWRMMRTSDHEDILQRAQYEDEGKRLMLLLTVSAAAVSLWSIFIETGTIKNVHGLEKNLRIILTALTIFTSWLFTHTIFALHYAHDYYLAQSDGEDTGFSFPGKQAPDYRDFLYFSAIIGTSGQTADVSLTTHRSRRIGTLHCIFAFFYNATILALLINITAGLISG